jgi:hypothetical protein
MLSRAIHAIAVSPTVDLRAGSHLKGRHPPLPPAFKRHLPRGYGIGERLPSDDSRARDGDFPSDVTSDDFDEFDMLSQRSAEHEHATLRLEGMF